MIGQAFRYTIGVSSPVVQESIKASPSVIRLAYSIKEAAEVTGVTPWTIHTAIAEGRLTARKLGKAWLVLHNDLAKFLESLDPASPSTKWLAKRKKVAA